MEDLNKYIKKSHIKMVENFNADLEAFRKETEEPAATLYENAYTSFTLSNIRVENGCLCYTYDGQVLHAQRTYLTQGVTCRGRKYYKDMRWFAFTWLSDGGKQIFPGIPAESLSKQQLLTAIIRHPQFTQASNELKS